MSRHLSEQGCPSSLIDAPLGDVIGDFEYGQISHHYFLVAMADGWEFPDLVAEQDRDHHGYYSLTMRRRIK